MTELYTIAITQAYKQQTKDQNNERRQILSQLAEQNKRMQNVREMAADKELDPNDFRMLKAECTKKIDELETKLAGLSDPAKGVDNLLKDGICKLSRLDVLYENGTVKEKRDIIGSMFPENLTFDGFQHRTTRVNEAARLIYFIDNELQDKKKDKCRIF